MILSHEINFDAAISRRNNSELSNYGQSRQQTCSSLKLTLTSTNTQMMAWKIAPALASGCTIVFKPSEVTPLSALKIASLFPKVGYPAGVFNLVNGTGPLTGTCLSSHPDIDKIAFTGSTAVGRDIDQKSLESNLKKVGSLR